MVQFEMRLSHPGELGSLLLIYLKMQTFLPKVYLTTCASTT